MLKKFKTGLQSVTLVLNDAEEKQGKSQEVKAWRDELLDVVYHIEDLVDEISTEAQQQEFDAESHGEISPVRGIHLLGKWVKSHKKGIEKKMGQILARLKSLAKRRDELGWKKRIQNEMKQSPSMPTSPSVDDSEVFGRDDDKEAIFEPLLSDDASGEELSVIPIVGEVGIGKTALALLIYNDHRVREHFELKAWAHVSDHFDMFMVTKAIFESFTMQSCDLKDLNLPQVRLQEGVRGKKFLLVLDDVWAETYHDWEFYCLPLKELLREVVLLLPYAYNLLHQWWALKVLHYERIIEYRLLVIVYKICFSRSRPEFISRTKSYWQRNCGAVWRFAFSIKNTWGSLGP